MSDEGLKTEVTVGAKIDEALAAIAKLSDQFKQFGEQTQKQFNVVGQASDMLLGKLKALVAGFLSIEGIRRGISATQEFISESNKLANQMGITRAEASQLNVAINDVGVSTEEVGSIMQRQSRNLRSQEDAMNQMGVKTRDANNQLLGQKDIFLNSLEVLREYKAGTDRNQAAMVLFGGRVGDVSKLMRINNEVIEEGKKKADELGLTLTESAVRGAREYKAALNDAGDVTLALQKIIGDQVMPVLTNLLNFFSERGPAAVKVFRLAFTGLIDVVDGFMTACKMALIVLESMLRVTATTFFALNDILTNIFSPSKWRGIVGAAYDTIAAESAGMLERIDREAAQFTSRQQRRWGLEGGGQAGQASGGTKTFTKPISVEEQAAALDAQAKAGKIALATYEEELSQEVVAKRMKESEKTELMRTATRNQYNLEKYVLEQKMALYSHDVGKQRAMQAEINLARAQYYLDDLKLSGQTTKAQEKEQEELAQRQIQANNARVQLMEAQADLQKQVWAEEVAQGTMTAREKLELERKLLVEIHNARMANWEQERELLKDKDKEQERILQEMAQAQVKHDTEMRKNNMAIVDEMLAKWKTAFDGISSAFGTMVKGVLMGTQTLGQGLRGFATSVLGVFLDMGVKMLAAEGMKWLKLKLMGETAAGEQVATSLAAVAAQKAIAIPAAIAEITRSAAVTFAGVFANLAPFMGPLAAEPAAVSQGAVLAQIPAASFDVGSWSVPRDMLAQIHRDEMIVPAGMANEMRTAGGSLGGVNLTYNDHSGRLTDTEIERNGRKLAHAVAGHLRKLGFSF